MKSPVQPLAKNGNGAKGKSKTMVGPTPKGPHKCIHCHQPFKAGERWIAVTSPEDPEYGSYTIGIHATCRQSAS